MPLQDEDGQAKWILASGPDAQCPGTPAFITPQGKVFKWKVMPFGVANAHAFFSKS